MAEHSHFLQILWGFLTSIFSWGYTAAIAVPGFCAAISMALAPQWRNIRLAHVLFAISWFWTFGFLVELIALTKIELKFAIPLIFLITGLTGVMALLSYRWVEQNLHESKTTTTSNANSTTMNEQVQSPTLNSFEDSNYKYHPPNINEDKFVVIVPFDPSNKIAPIPINENRNDPSSKFFSDLTFLSIYQSHKEGKVQQVQRDFTSRQDRTKFIGKLLQFYILHYINIMQHDQEGLSVDFQNNRSRVWSHPRIIPPDNTLYPQSSLLSMISKSEFFTSMEESNWTNEMQMTAPKHINIQMFEQNESSSVFGDMASYGIRFERQKYITLEFLATEKPAIIGIPTGQNPASPKRYITSRKGIVGYPFVITMRYKIERSNDPAFASEEYSKWAESLFTGLRKQMETNWDW